MPALIWWLSLQATFYLAGAVFMRTLHGHAGYQRLTSASGAHMLQLDGLRGILALSVFVHHAMVWRGVARGEGWHDPRENVFAQLGPFAVTLFFFITGFLFWTKLIRTPKLNIRGFWKGRFKRLVPVYAFAITTLFVVIAALSHWRRMEAWPSLGREAGAWLLFGIPGMPDVNGLRQTFTRIAGVIWTLRYEWYFYAVLPLLQWFAKRWYRLPILLLPAAAVLYLESGEHHFAFFFLFCFSFGMAAAWVRIKLGAWHPLRAPVAALAAVALVLAALLWCPPRYGWLESLLLFPAFCIIVCGNTLGGQLVRKPMLLLGQISYSVYLLHGLVLAIVFALIGNKLAIGSWGDLQYWLFVAALGFLVVGVCTLSYRLLELPLLHKTGVLPRAEQVPPRELTPPAQETAPI